jgi:membrane protease YdiL (CAAX protease family)
MKKAISVIIIFLAAQVATPIVAVYILKAIGDSGLFGQVNLETVADSPIGLSILLIIAYGTTVLALYGFRLLSPGAGLARRALHIIPAVLTLLFAEVPITFMQEILKLPDITVNTNVGPLMHNALGIITIVIVGPVVEELVFRRAVLGSLMEGGMRPLRAVIISGLLFGLIHFNPAQMLPAAILGCLLGWVYVRTGNLLSSIILHAINNGLSVLIANTAYADTTLSELTGSTALSAVAACLCAGIAILLLRIYNKHTEEEPIITEEVNED